MWKLDEPEVSMKANDEAPEFEAVAFHNHVTASGSGDGGSCKEATTPCVYDSKLEEEEKVNGDKEALEGKSRNGEDGEDDKDSMSDGEDSMSDGDDVEQAEEYYRLKDVERERKKDHDNQGNEQSVDDRMKELRTRHQDLEQRIKLAPKRMKQYNQYTRILEERIGLLEERCIAFDKKIVEEAGIFVPPVLPEAKPPPISTLNPDLGFKFWQDFSSKETATNIIDVLVGEPAVPRSEMIRRKKASTRGGQEAMSVLEDKMSANHVDISDGRNLDEEVANFRGKQLPERVRFNVSSIPRLFWKSCNGEAWDDTMLRPFKHLIRKADEIQDVLSSMQQVLIVMFRERAASLQDESSQVPKPNERVLNVGENTTDAEGNKESKETDSITKAEWESIVKDFNLYHCEDCVDAMALEWPNKSAFDRSCDSVRNLIDSIILPVHLKFRERSSPSILFQDLWHLFQTDDLIVDRMHTQSAGTSLSNVKCRRVLITRGGRRVLHPSFPPPLIPWAGSFLEKEEEPLAPINGINVFAIYAYYLDFDGSVWRPVRERFIIHPYSGERKITDLDVYPIKYAYKTEEKLQARGKRFHDLVTAKTVPYVDCTGIDLDTKEDINDKVIVDFRSYFNSEMTELDPFNPPGAMNISETSDCYAGLECSSAGMTESRCPHRKQRISPDQTSDLEVYQAFVYGKVEFNSVPYDLKLWVPDFAICHYRIFAYKLQSRDWGT